MHKCHLWVWGADNDKENGRNLATFEREALRKMYGPIREKDGWYMDLPMRAKTIVYGTTIGT